MTLRADDQGRSLPDMQAKGFIIHEGHAGPIAVVPDDLSIRVSALALVHHSLPKDQLLASVSIHIRAESERSLHLPTADLQAKRDKQRGRS